MNAPGGAGGRATDTPEPLFERFTVTYPSGTVMASFYPGGAPLEEVRVTHPTAAVKAIEDSRVGVGPRS